MKELPKVGSPWQLPTIFLVGIVLGWWVRVLPIQSLNPSTPSEAFNRDDIEKVAVDAQVLADFSRRYMLTDSCSSADCKELIQMFSSPSSKVRLSAIGISSGWCHEFKDVVSESLWREMEKPNSDESFKVIVFALFRLDPKNLEKTRKYLSNIDDDVAKARLIQLRQIEQEIRQIKSSTRR
jgi:hypothetical protein